MPQSFFFVPKDVRFVEYKVLVNFLAGQNSLAEKIPIKCETFFLLLGERDFMD